MATLQLLSVAFWLLNVSSSRLLKESIKTDPNHFQFPKRSLIASTDPPLFYNAVSKDYWVTVEAECQENGDHLASIHCVEENTEAYKTCNQNTCWIGHSACLGEPEKIFCMTVNPTIPPGQNQLSFEVNGWSDESVFDYGITPLAFPWANPNTPPEPYWHDQDYCKTDGCCIIISTNPIGPGKWSTSKGAPSTPGGPPAPTGCNSGTGQRYGLCRNASIERCFCPTDVCSNITTNQCATRECVNNLCVDVPTVGKPCNDGDRCTLTDICQDINGIGVCIGGDYCEDNIECTLDICDAFEGCINQPINSNCKDGNICTEDCCDVEKGGCIYTNITCPTINDKCLENKGCDPILGCLYEPFICVDDGFICTQEICIDTSGECVSIKNDAKCQCKNGTGICNPLKSNDETGCVCELDSSQTNVTIQPNPTDSSSEDYELFDAVDVDENALNNNDTINYIISVSTQSMVVISVAILSVILIGCVCVFKFYAKM